VRTPCCAKVSAVANANRGLVPGSAGTNAEQTVTAVNTQAALSHRPAVIGDITAGLFPRDLSFDPKTGWLLLANFNSDTIELFRRLPAP
jgi:6-phosphogluconolactonase (cycloisomerase 2 family)